MSEQVHVLSEVAVAEELGLHLVVRRRTQSFGETRIVQQATQCGGELVEVVRIGDQQPVGKKRPSMPLPLITTDSCNAMESLIRQIDRLHSVPGVAQKILGLIRKPDFSLKEVAECLEHDPALSARVLGLVNSSRYGLANRVTSIRHAAALLGQRSLRLVTLSFSLIDATEFGGGAGEALGDEVGVENWLDSLREADAFTFDTESE